MNDCERLLACHGVMDPRVELTLDIYQANAFRCYRYVCDEEWQISRHPTAYKTAERNPWHSSHVRHGVPRRSASYRELTDSLVGGCMRSAKELTKKLGVYSRFKIIDCDIRKYVLRKRVRNLVFVCADSGISRRHGKTVQRSQQSSSPGEQLLEE